MAMKKFSDFSKPELEFFIANCNFTDDEMEVFECLSKGYTIRQIELKCAISESTVVRRANKIKEKIERIEEQNVRKEVPLYEKYNLTVDEAAAYFNIGTDRIRSIIEENKSELVLMVGTKKLIKKKKMEDFLDKMMVL